MKWQGRRTSANLEDRRRGTSGGGMGGGGGAKLGGLGLVVVVVLALAFGIDPAVLLQGGGLGPSQTADGPPADDADAQFLGVVLADTEEVWAEIFARSGRQYTAPRLVLFSGQTGSACGSASATSGPFYCPADRMAYLDTQFFDVLERQLGARGDFARAYVVAHEIAHHVQNELGVMAEVARARRGASEAEANELSVRVELQADCYAGLWAHHAARRFGSLEPGDIDEALNAAAKIGDDTLQRNAGRAVVPDSFTHGTSAQRMRWFRAGYDSGNPGACDTFKAARL